MPGAIPFSRSDFPKLYAQRLAYIKKLIGVERWPEAERQWEGLFRIEPSSKMREEFLEYSGLGSFRELAENENVTYDNIIQGPKKVFTHLVYGLGYQIGWLAGEHDLDGIINKHAPALGRAMRNTIQVQAAAFWNGAFTVQKTADGLYYFDTGHTYVRGGGTWDNMPSVVTTLGHTALETAIVSFRTQKDLMGEPQPLPCTRLLIPPAYEPMAHELLVSGLRHDTTTHADSFLTKKLTVESWPYLTITTMWAVLAPKEYTEIYWFWNVKPETTHGFDFDSGAAKTKTLYACSLGAVDPRGSYGSKGA